MCHRQFRPTGTRKLGVVALHSEEKNVLAGSLLKLIHLFRAVPCFHWLERFVLFDMRLACDGITWRRTPRPDHQRSRGAMNASTITTAKSRRKQLDLRRLRQASGPACQVPPSPPNSPQLERALSFCVMIMFSSSLALLVGFSVKNDRSHHRDDETSAAGRGTIEQIEKTECYHREERQEREGKRDDRTDRED